MLHPLLDVVGGLVLVALQGFQVPPALLGAPRAEERAVVQQSRLGDVMQRLDDVVEVHMAEQDAQAERLLELADANEDVVWVQQVVPEQ